MRLSRWVKRDPYMRDFKATATVTRKKMNVKFFSKSFMIKLSKIPSGIHASGATKKET